MNGTALHGELERTTQRWPVATAARVDRFVKDRVQAATQAQSRRLLATARAELANRALLAFVALVYEEGKGARMWNVCEDTNRILIPTPWSRTKHATYGLTDDDGRILRAFMVERLASLPEKYQPFLYAGGRWYLNVRRYPDAATAAGWVQQWGLTAELWMEHADRLRRRGRR